MFGENTLDQIQLQVLKEKQAREAGLSPYLDLHEAKSEKEVAKKMKEKGYEYIILVPGKDALYAKSVKMAAELARTDLKDYRVGIQKIDDFLAGKKLKGFKEETGLEPGEEDLVEMRGYDRKTADAGFKLLAKALKTYGLPVSGGKYRKGVDADEFMFMGLQTAKVRGKDEDVYAFKHRDTRNYLYVTMDGKIIVPKGGPFAGGVFDSGSAEGCDTPGMKKRSKGKGRGLARGDGKGPMGIPVGAKEQDDDDDDDDDDDEGCDTPGMKKKSGGNGRGLARGGGKGPRGIPFKAKGEDEDWDEDDLDEGDSPDMVKLRKIGKDAKSLREYLFKNSNPNLDQARKKIIKMAKAALKLDNVLFGDDKKKVADIAAGKFPDEHGNPELNAAIRLAKICEDVDLDEKRKHEDDLDEAKKVKGEEIYAALKKIVDEKQAAKINGVLVDLFSASAMVQVLDALNAQNRKKLLSMDVPTMHKIVFAIVNKKKEDMDTDLDEFVTEWSELDEKSAKNIKAVNPGISKLPEGAWDEWGVSKLAGHFKKLGSSIGKPEAMRAILNIERWNKNQNPKLSEKARSVIDMLKKDKDWSGEDTDIDIDQEALAELETMAEASETGHYYVHGKDVYGDSAFLRAVGYNIEKILPGFEMKHMGFGEFYLDGGSKGRVDFARTSPSAKLGIGGDRTTLPEQVGRLHRVYDDKGGRLVKEILKKAKNIKQVKLAIKDDVALGMMDDELDEFVIIDQGPNWKTLEKKAAAVDKFMKQFMDMVKKHQGGRKLSTTLSYLQNAIGDFRVDFKEDLDQDGDDLDEAIKYAWSKVKQMDQSQFTKWFKSVGAPAFVSFALSGAGLDLNMVGDRSKYMKASERAAENTMKFIKPWFIQAVLDYMQYREKQLGINEERGTFLDDAEDVIGQLKGVLAKIEK